MTSHELFNLFLNRVDLPTEEDFNNAIEILPPIKDFGKDVEYDPYYDSLEYVLFKYGVMNDINNNIIPETVDVCNRSITLDIWDNDYPKECLESLNTFKESLEKYNWTISNYNEIKKDLEELINEEKAVDYKSELIDEIKKLSIETLEKIVNDYKK